jgi:hypothetical protein
VTESRALPPIAERAMCRKCDNVRYKIAAARELLAELTDPASISLSTADIEILEENLIRVVAKHHPAER